MLFRAVLFFLEIFRIAYRVYVVNRVWNKSRVRKEVTEVYHRRGLPFDEAYFKRIYFYLMVASIVKIWFTTLRGKKESKKERMAFAYIGASTPLYDDLFDENELTYQQVKHLLSEGNTKGYGIIAAIGIVFYEKLMSCLDHPNTFMRYLDLIAIAQDQSKAQVGGHLLSELELRQITYDKGGYSIVAYRTILTNELLPGEEKAAYHLGCICQLTNDIFDLRKDHLNNQQTFLTRTDDIQTVRKEYLDLVHKTTAAFRKLDYSNWNLRRFELQLMLIVGRGMVCLDQLARVQKKYGKWDASLMLRSESVCDMEKPINLMRYFWYSLKDPAELE